MATLRRCQPLLGSYVEIAVSADLPSARLVEMSSAAFDSIRGVQQRMSFHDPLSELSVINRDAVRASLPISADMAAVLHCALEISVASNGLFDVTVARELVARGSLPKQRALPSAVNWQAIELNADRIRFHDDVIIDLGGIAKGFAVDQAFRVLCEYGDPFDQICINAGGDLRMLHWVNEIVHLRMRSPRRDPLEATLTMLGPALATSAHGEGSPASRIIHPKSWKDCSAVGNVSVFAKSCIVADAMTKCLSLDPDAHELLSHFGAIAAQAPVMFP